MNVHLLDVHFKFDIILSTIRRVKLKHTMCGEWFIGIHHTIICHIITRQITISAPVSVWWSSACCSAAVLTICVFISTKQSSSARINEFDRLSLLHQIIQGRLAIWQLPHHISQLSTSDEYSQRCMRLGIELYCALFYIFRMGRFVMLKCNLSCNLGMSWVTRVAPARRNQNAK